MPSKVYIALGSNLGNREQNISIAIDKLRSNPMIAITKVSKSYDTEPLLKDGAEGQARYLNGVIEIETTLRPEDILQVLQEIETDLGRPLPRKSGDPRTIDLDLLLFDDQTFDTPKLTVPHPKLHKRMFVLQPLYDIAPDLIHPTLKVSIGDLKRELDKLSK